MSETTANGRPDEEAPRITPSRLSRVLAGIALLRESPVGMTGAVLVLIWIGMALLAAINTWMVDAGLLQLGIVFPPNATLAPLMPPLSDFIVGAGVTVNDVPVEQVCTPRSPAARTRASTTAAPSGWAPTTSAAISGHASSTARNRC